MKDKQQSYFVNIGSSSLLVIFLVLCLVTFAILSLSSAKSDYSFSERLAAHRKNYYEASARAEDVTGEIDRILSAAAEEIDLSGHNDTDRQEKTALYYDAVAAALDGKQIDGTAVQLEQEEDGIFLVFRIEAEEGQELLVRLQVNDCWSQETYYEIRTWKIISTDRQEEEKPLNLLPIIQ